MDGFHIKFVFGKIMKLRVRLFRLLEKVIMKFKFYIKLKKLKIDFFFLQKLLFSNFSKKLKTDFFDNMIIFKKLSKYIKIDFLIKKVIFYPKKS